MKKIEYKEIFRLKAMLENARIEHEFIDRSIDDIESYQIIIRKSKEELEEMKLLETDEDYESYSRLVSVIEGYMSYGGNLDLLEIMGLTENDEDVEGYLSADEVFARIVKVYI